MRAPPSRSRSSSREHDSLAQSFVASGRAVDDSGAYDHLMLSGSYRSELDLVGFVEDLDAEALSFPALHQRLIALDD